MYSNCKIYGPYTRKDGRKHVIVVYKNGNKTTISYPKFLMENHLNRKLTKDETVDHIDMDINNNNLSNLRVLDRGVHCYLDAKRNKAMDFICPTCGGTFTLNGRTLSQAKINKKKRKTAGPFCSRSCAGKYGKAVQQNKSDIIECEEIHTKTIILKLEP